MSGKTMTMKKLVCRTALLSFTFAVVAHAQTKPSGPTKALSHAIHAVEDLDTTLAFYRDVFGLNGIPESGQHICNGIGHSSSRYGPTNSLSLIHI